ncbi:Ig-like domain-containing protein [Aurantimonas sp. Leaf443]|uniref:Ig-like domain-containing protein n=1 Tax=Aurantimonas sp. Leaf443 TaxID=1736378 RepID=UPI0006F51D10|nr:Ig-like domain-containing protein [Aurantimonas sp. Leaf443]KQT88378.1 hypothetical protein ASG48_02860 [Aurantimonas sp. Leaf443]
MHRKALAIVLFCLVLLAAIVAGYWDMLNSESQRLSRTPDLAGDEAAPQDAPAVSSVGTPSAQAPAASVPAPATEAAAPGTGPAAPAETASAPAAGEAAPAPASGRAASANGVVPPAPVAADGSPTFDILRVEPDGSTIVAGKAAPGTAVTLSDGERVLGSDTANAAGEFVVVLGDPLPAGDHELRIRAQDEAGRSSVSKEAAVVSVPGDGAQGQVLAMVETPDAPSRIISRPQAEPAGTAPPAANAPAAGEDAATPAGAPASPRPQAGTPPSAAEPQDPAEPPLRVDAVEIEDRSVYVAGSGTPGSTVRLYVDNDFLAAAPVGPDGRFLVTAQSPVAVGPHMVRADEISASGAVSARAEVPFERPEGVAVAAVSPAPEPAAAPVDTVPAAPSAARGEPPRAPAAQDVVPGGAQAPARQTPSDAPLAGGPAPVGEAARAPAASPALSPAPAPAPAPATAEPDAGVPVRRQAALQASEPRVIIRKGDTLWRISRETYGRGSRYTVIYLANGQQIRDPDRIYPGQIFRIPKDEAAPGAKS